MTIKQGMSIGIWKHYTLKISHRVTAAEGCNLIWMNHMATDNSILLWTAVWKTQTAIIEL